MKIEEDVITAIADIKHPAINHTLLDLGIVKNIEVTDGIATIMFAFPFPEIPIEDVLVYSIAKPIKSLGLAFEYKTMLMTEKEKSKFMQMEAEAWRM